jgi:hypothetical protein
MNKPDCSLGLACACWSTHQGLDMVVFDGLSLIFLVIQKESFELWLKHADTLIVHSLNAQFKTLNQSS